MCEDHKQSTEAKKKTHAEYIRQYRMKQTPEKRKEQAVYKTQSKDVQNKQQNMRKNHAVTVSRTAVKMHKYRSDQTEQKRASYKQKRPLKQSAEQKGKHAAELRKCRSTQTEQKLLHAIF